MLVAVCIAALLLSGCGNIDFTPDEDDLRVLFVGNSLTYTNDLPAVVLAMAREDGRHLVVQSVALPNYSLEDHWLEGSAKAALAEGGWDYVVMQQGPSSLPENQIHLRIWAKRFADEARKFGTEPALFTVWPAAIHSSGFPAVVESYANAASAVDGLLLPAGKAWLLAWDEEPSLALYGPDRFHPGELGTYLSALVIYGGLFDTSVRNIPAALRIDDDTIIQVPQTTASILKDAAREALR